MNTIQIEILNPKAIKLLQDLADLKLISINQSIDNDFEKILKKLRTKSKSALSLEEISKEVELVRTVKYGKNH